MYQTRGNTEQEMWEGIPPKQTSLPVYTGWTIQIVATFKITLQLNYKTYRKSEDCFGFVGKRATKH